MKKTKNKLLSLVTAFLLVLALVPLLPEGTIKASAATSYNLYLFDKQVTSANASDILGDGAASYDAGSNTLTFKKDITGNGTILQNQIKGLTIKTTGALTLESKNAAGFGLAKDATIRTKGKLTLKVATYYLGIYCSSYDNNKPVITIKDSDLETNYIDGHNNDSALNIINSNIKVVGGMITGFNKGIHLTNCFVRSPEKVEIYYGEIYTKRTANLRATNVEICRSRLAGKNRYDTAAVISKASYDKASHVILASGESYADALAGVVLADKLEAPVLLTRANTLPAETLAEIKRLGAKNITILGGESAVSKKIETLLSSNGCNVNRLAGASRFGTAAAVADRINTAPTVLFFVYGLDYADALSVSPVASVMGAPIIYLNKDGSMNAETASYLAALKKKGCVRTAYVIGGEGVISKAMMQKASDALGLIAGKQVVRVSGANRYETCMKVNATFYFSVPSNMICVATGLDFPDALAGGVFAAKHSAMLFLVNGKADSITKDQKEFIKDKSPNGMAVFGGTGAVSDKTVESINAAS